MTEFERHSTIRTLVASFLFTDLVGYSKGTAAEQYAAKATLSTILSTNLAALRSDDYRIKDTGDGALIAFVSNPEHALYIALAIAEDFGRAAGEAGFPSNSLRTGVHLGSVKESTDFEARPNFVGDGINAAKRIMDFAAPGQITASRAFFDAVASLDSAYAELFRHVGAPDDKHGRAHELYAISPSATVLEKLRLDLGAATRESADFAKKGATSINVKPMPVTAVATGSPAKPSRVEIRKVVIPAIAVIVLAIASLYVGTNLVELYGSRSSQATSETVVSPATPNRVVAPPTPTVGIAAGSQAPPASAPKPEATPPVRAARVAEGAPAPDLTRPTTAPTAAAATTIPKMTPKTDTSQAAPVPANTGSERNGPRCSRIMEKATLGEALSTEEKKELASSCR